MKNRSSYRSTANSIAMIFFLAGSYAVGSTAAAQDLADQSIGEIIVTAQRRSENLQSVPVAITALPAGDIARANISDVTDLRLSVPSLNIVKNNGVISSSLRGIGSTGVNPGFENPVATYVDGVYLAAPIANLLSLSDVSQVDVLKGPQGTLFGRNATAGLLQITTRQPTQTPHMEAKVGYANYDTIFASAYVAGGVTDDVTASIAAYRLHQGKGYGRNLTTGTDSYRVDEDALIHGKIRFESPTGTVVTISGDYARAERNDLYGVALPGTVNGFVPAAGPTPDYRYDQVADAPTYKKGWAKGLSGKLEQPLGPLMLTSITAYRKSRFSTAFDYDMTQFPIADLSYTQFDDQFSQELQLQPDSSSGRLIWVVGGYYFNAHTGYEPVNLNLYLPAPGTGLAINDRQKTESIAAYAQGTYEILQDTKLTLGGRYTTEKRWAYDGATTIALIDLGLTLPPVPSPDDSARFNKFTFRIALDRQLTRDILGYVSVNRGFKSGGFNTGMPGLPAYKPETLDAYEVGLKTDLFDRALRLNVAGYYYDYKNIQSQQLTAGLIQIVNAAAAHVYGLDVDFEARPAARLRITGGLGLNHARYTNFSNSPISDPQGGSPSSVGSAKGNSLPLAADFTANATLSYTVPVGGGTLIGSGNILYSSGYALASDNAIRQPRFAQLGTTLTWNSPDDRLSIGVFGKNLTNKRIISSATNVPSVGTQAFLYGQPRTYGLTAGVKF